jgi:hypothetical protein
MGSKNLSEEIFKMRKLMNFNSSHYRENVTSYDRLLEERILKKHLLKEEGEEGQPQTNSTEPPKFHDWSKGGSVNWENAKIKDIIKYVKEVDDYIDPSIKNNPSYEIMMEWFINNDSPETKSSLKNWMFGEIYYGITKTEPTKKNKKNEVKPDKYDEEMQKNIPTLLSKINIETLKSKITDVKGLEQIKKLESTRTLEKLKKEAEALNSANVFLPKSDINDISERLESIVDFVEGKHNDVNDTINRVSALVGLNLQKKGAIGLKADSDSKIKVGEVQGAGLKKQLLSKLSEDVEKMGEDTFKKIIGKINTIKITDKPESLEQVRLDDGKVKVIPKMVTGESQMFQYPPVTEDTEKRNEMSRNFFPDDGTQMSDSAREGLKEQIVLLRKFINQQEDDVIKLRNQHNLGEDFALVVESINIYVYGSTSKVRTTYKSKDKTFSEKNNIQLAEDRCDTIETSIRNMLDRLGLGKYNIVLGSKVTRPNIGPGWEKIDGKNADGSEVPISQYGELFQIAYKRFNDAGKKITPQMFYGNRTESSAIQASKYAGREISQKELRGEYNKVYGPYRMNLGGLTVTLKKPEVVTKEEVGEDYYVIAVPGLGLQFDANGEFNLTDTWNDLKRGIRKIRKKLGRVSFKPRTRPFVPKWTCPTCCPGF